MLGSPDDAEGHVSERQVLTRRLTVRPGASISRITAVEVAALRTLGCSTRTIQR